MNNRIKKLNCKINVFNHVLILLINLVAIPCLKHLEHNLSSDINQCNHGNQKVPRSTALVYIRDGNIDRLETGLK